MRPYTEQLTMLSKVLSSLLILLNLPLLYATILILSTGGGTWGYGLIVLPFTLIAHLSLIPAYLRLRKKSASLNWIALLVLGLIYCTFLVGLIFMR